MLDALRRPTITFGVLSNRGGRGQPTARTLAPQPCPAHTLDLLLDLDITQVGLALLFGQAADQQVEQRLGLLAPLVLGAAGWRGEVDSPAGRIVKQQRRAGRAA